MCARLGINKYGQRVGTSVNKEIGMGSNEQGVGCGEGNSVTMNVNMGIVDEGNTVTGGATNKGQ